MPLSLGFWRTPWEKTVSLWHSLTLFVNPWMPWSWRRWIAWSLPRETARSKPEDPSESDSEVEEPSDAVVLPFHEDRPAPLNNNFSLENHEAHPDPDTIALKPPSRKFWKGWW